MRTCEMKTHRLSAKCILFYEICLRLYIVSTEALNIRTVLACSKKWIKCLSRGSFLFKSWSVAHMDDSNEPRGVPGPDPGSPHVCFYCTSKGRLWLQAHCEKVTGESATSVCRSDTTGPAQHPEVGTSLGTSALCLISIIVDKGLRLGLH